LRKISDSSDPFILFDHVWKEFRRGERHDILRDMLPALAQRVFRGTRNRKLHAGDFWALRDVSFEVKPGMALGIIGPNGAGKSTILKLLTKLVKPTRGSCAVHGRIGALIDVAAGFHPDLTGRENVYLQGAVMGMKRAEVARKFSDIVDFAEVGDFMDTPVKRFSSGMNARLGFSVAAHLDPEILLIDEVLAVGDLAFQQKAFDRIAELVRRKIPVVVVSHQLERIAALCSDGILLHRGRIVCRGSPSQCIASYVEQQSSDLQTSAGRCALLLHSIYAANRPEIPSGKLAALLVECSLPSPAAQAGPLRSQSEEIVLRVRSTETGEALFAVGTAALGVDLPTGPFALAVELQMNVRPGLYVIETIVRDCVLDKYLANGPHTSVYVTPGQLFRGKIQMNPRISVLRRESFANCDPKTI
jgi:ABC-type polysaccharide/polyol phosphate transport system ATPase subunit